MSLWPGKVALGRAEKSLGWTGAMKQRVRPGRVGFLPLAMGSQGSFLNHQATEKQPCQKMLEQVLERARFSVGWLFYPDQSLGFPMRAEKPTPAGGLATLCQHPQVRISSEGQSTHKSFKPSKVVGLLSAYHGPGTEQRGLQQAEMAPQPCPHRAHVGPGPQLSLTEAIPQRWRL